MLGLEVDNHIFDEKFHLRGACAVLLESNCLKTLEKLNNLTYLLGF